MAVCEMRGFPAFSDGLGRPPFTMAERSKICVSTGAGDVGICTLREGCWSLGAGDGDGGWPNAHTTCDVNSVAGETQ